ncbi:hypothetical protein PV760_13925, partial [Paenarthrobacter sp. CC6]|uniref:hypothetical protein n=1 Tax=Paenarthrobacter sp. CC6 TaxID=3029184 RepID=UPI00339C4544
MNRENGQVHSDDNNQDLNGLDPVEAADPETLPANSSVAGFSGQLSKGLRDPMEGIGKQLASSLTMSGIVNYKSPLLDMKVPSALTGFSEQLSKGLRDPMEGIGKQLASSLTMSG